jgi:hypothetical protein
MWYVYEKILFVVSTEKTHVLTLLSGLTQPASCSQARKAHHV